jgi:hypothetical protein
METHGDRPDRATITDASMPNPADPATLHTNTKDSTVHLDGRTPPYVNEVLGQPKEPPLTQPKTDQEENQQDGALQFHPDDDSALQILTEDGDGDPGDHVRPYLAPGNTR